VSHHSRPVEHYERHFVFHSMGQLRTYLDRNYDWYFLNYQFTIEHLDKRNCPAWTNHECRCMVEPL